MKLNNMNKINVDNIILDNNNLFLEYENITSITSLGNSKLNLFNCNIINLNITVKENSHLVINYYSVVYDNKSIINIFIENNASIILNHSFVNYNKYDLEVLTNFNGNDGKININIHGINDKGKTNIDVNGYVNNNNNNILDESIRLININGGAAVSNPNMYISTSKVIANHNTTIGGVRSDELFYLMSKGLNRSDSIKLICDGFLIKNISDEGLITKIKEYQSKEAKDA